jgi:hypothetical protein
MSAISTQADRLAKALTPLVREMLLEEVRRHARARREAAATDVDRQINAAARAVASAADQLTAARFSGAPEGAAHRRLVKAAEELGWVMRKHGRMPGGE